MRILNAAALACLLVIVGIDIAAVLPRVDFSASKYVDHVIFDFGTLALNRISASVPKSKIT